MPSTVEIGMLPATAASDPNLVSELASLINDVYKVAEDGLWADGAARTTAAEVTALIEAGQLATGTVDGQLAGCIRTQLLDNSTSPGGGRGEKRAAPPGAPHVGEFGMLAVGPGWRGTGLGRALVRFAEQACRARHCDTMQLELLVPRGWTHPSKEFLHGWYTRIGYQRFAVGEVEESYPHLAPLLATPCDFVIYRKDLNLSGTSTSEAP